MDDGLAGGGTAMHRDAIEIGLRHRSQGSGHRKAFRQPPSGIILDVPGQALVEFALILPLVLMLLVGMLEFGRLYGEFFGLHLVMEHVSSDAARLGGYGPELDAVLLGHSFPFLDPTRVRYHVHTQAPDGELVCSTGTCTCEYGQYVVVEGRYPTGVQILFFRRSLTLETRHVLHCWRGGAP